LTNTMGIFNISLNYVEESTASLRV
jgi:hypothetical protein